MGGACCCGAQPLPMGKRCPSGLCASELLLALLIAEDNYKSMLIDCSSCDIQNHRKSSEVKISVSRAATERVSCPNTATLSTILSARLLIASAPVNADTQIFARRSIPPRIPAPHPPSRDGIYRNSSYPTSCDEGAPVPVGIFL